MAWPGLAWRVAAFVFMGAWRRQNNILCLRKVLFCARRTPFFGGQGEAWLALAGRGASVLAQVVVPRSLNKNFAEKVSFGAQGMALCQGTLQAKKQHSTTTNVLPARDTLFLKPPELRIEEQAEAWLSLTRPSVSQFLNRHFA